MPSTLSNKKMNLDKKVWFVMFITSLICVAFVSYSFVTKEKCTPFTLNIQGLTINEGGFYEVGEPLFFRASLATDKEIVWDFGDKSERQTSRSVISKHTYIKEGIYTIRASAQGACLNGDVRVSIKKPEGPEGPKGTKPLTILGNTSLKAGQSATYISDFIGGADYEWKVLDQSSFPAVNGQSAKFTFTKPGIYRLQLTVDHDRNNKRAIIEVTVNEPKKIDAVVPPIPIPIPKPKPKPQPGRDTVVKPTPAPPDIRPAPDPTPVPERITPPAARVVNKQIGNRGFKAMLQSVVAGETQMEEFDEFLFNKGNTLVKINDERGVKKFSELFNKIKGKKYEVENVNLIHDPNEATIVTKIEVQLKDGRNLFDKITGKH